MNHSELTHKWAHADAEQSRRSGSMSFSGPTLYSYSTPIARIYRHAKRGAFVLVADHSYSMTTAKHIGLAMRAVSHLPTLRVPRYVIGSHGAGRYRYSVSEKQDHADNLAHFADSAAALLKQAQRVLQVSGVEWRRHQAAAMLRQWQEYAAFFGIRRKAPELPAAEWEAARARAERIENPDPVRDAARFKARERARALAGDVEEYRAEMERSMRAAGHGYLGYNVHVGKRWPQMLARMIGAKGEPWYHEQARRTNWRLGLSSYVRSDPVMLRVAGEEIETSAGARIPLAAAPMVWQIVERTRKAGGRNFAHTLQNGGYKIGDYPLDAIDADGTLHAGCHVIPHSELRSMARQLGLAS